MIFSDEIESEDQSDEINITPLVDIVFLLLIFFMVSTTFVESHGINVKLPAASSAPTQDVKKDVSVSISSDGKYFVEDKALSLTQLKEVLSQEKASVAQLTLVVRADKGAQHGVVVQVLDLGRSVGIEKIAIATTPKSQN